VSKETITETGKKTKRNRVVQCIVVCCSVLHCVAVCRSVLQCVAVCCQCCRRLPLRSAATWACVLQWIAVCCSPLPLHSAVTWTCVLQLLRYVAASPQRNHEDLYCALCYSVLHCAAVCCSYLSLRSATTWTRPPFHNVLCLLSSPQLKEKGGGGGGGGG